MSYYPYYIISNEKMVLKMKNRGGNMSDVFFDELRKFILNEHEDELSTLIPHYENLIQHKDSIKPLMDELKEWRMDINFVDESFYHSIGKFEFHPWKDKDSGEASEHYQEQESPDYYYEIVLLEDERGSGYCFCEPSQEGYDHDKECCGNGCEWLVPKFELKKIETISRQAFVGEQRDMWELEEKWDEHLASFKEKKKNEKLSYMKNEMKRIEREITKLEKE